MIAENVLFEEAVRSSPITNLPTQSFTNLKHSCQVQIQMELHTKLAEDYLHSQKSNFQENTFQVKDGEVDFKNTDFVYSETFQNVQKNCPNRIEDPGQIKLTLTLNPVISELISIPQENLIDQQQNTSNQYASEANSMISPNSHEDQGRESDEDDAPTLLLNPNKKKRQNGSNHVHKKMITALNKVISLPIKRKLKRLIQQEEEKTNLKLKYVKASRYGFIQYLQLLKHFFGYQFVDELAIKFSEQMLQLILKVEKLQNSQSKNYLLNLPEYYIIAFDQFLSGSVESATESIYKMDKFKQGTYMKQGVEKVMSLQIHLDALEQ